mmetsp:Transcript_9481/g.11650  ORF Transcript_9481/g.11650 Transcript_9481/m.11650 type:complete len:158 (-) Transcript_9481:1141-1614(-)
MDLLRGFNLTKRVYRIGGTQNTRSDLPRSLDHFLYTTLAVFLADSDHVFNLITPPVDLHLLLVGTIRLSFTSLFDFSRHLRILLSLVLLELPLTLFLLFLEAFDEVKAPLLPVLVLWLNFIDGLKDTARHLGGTFGRRLLACLHGRFVAQLLALLLS